MQKAMQLKTLVDSSPPPPLKRMILAAIIIILRGGGREIFSRILHKTIIIGGEVDWILARRHYFC